MCKTIEACRMAQKFKDVDCSTFLVEVFNIPQLFTVILLFSQMLHALIPFKGRIDRLMNIGESCTKSKARCMTFFFFFSQSSVASQRI